MSLGISVPGRNFTKTRRGISKNHGPVSKSHPPIFLKKLDTPGLSYLR